MFTCKIIQAADIHECSILISDEQTHLITTSKSSAKAEI